MPGARPRLSGSAVFCSYTKVKADTGTTFCSPWPDVVRPLTSSNVALSTAGKAWMPTDQVRGLRAHGPSPAKGISGCIERATNNRFRSTGQPWVEPGHDGRVNLAIRSEH